MEDLLPGSRDAHLPLPGRRNDLNHESLRIQWNIRLFNVINVGRSHEAGCGRCRVLATSLPREARAEFRICAGRRGDPRHDDGDPGEDRAERRAIMAFLKENTEGAGAW